MVPYSRSRLEPVVGSRLWLTFSLALRELDAVFDCGHILVFPKFLSSVPVRAFEILAIRFWGLGCLGSVISSRRSITSALVGTKLYYGDGTAY